VPLPRGSLSVKRFRRVPDALPEAPRTVKSRLLTGWGSSHPKLNKVRFLVIPTRRLNSTCCSGTVPRQLRGWPGDAHDG